MTIGMSQGSSGTPAAAPVVVMPETLDSMLGPVGRFPSANLLPPGIVNRRRVRAAKKRALLMLAGVLVLLILVVLFIGMQQRSADAAKADAQARVDQALILKQKYAYVPAVYQAVTTARTDLATAMGQEVQVSRLLRGLSAMQPVGLSLLTLDASVGPGGEEAATTTVDVVPGVGVISFQGEAKSMDQVAAWLDRLRLNPDYSAPLLNDVTNSTEGVYSFTASAELTEQALSGRYVEETR